MENLTQMFNQFNRQFFNGRLPRYRVTFYKALPSRGICLSERKLIRLSPDLPADKIRQVLLHEMCHNGVPDHGKRFLAKLARLAEQGEAWASDEIKMYSDPRALDWNAEVKQSIQDIFIDQPDAHFWPAMRFISKDLGVTPGQLLKRSPWVRATWKKARADARELHKIRAKRAAERDDPG